MCPVSRPPVDIVTICSRNVSTTPIPDVQCDAIYIYGSAGHNHDNHDAQMTANKGLGFPPSRAPDDLHGNLDMPSCRLATSHFPADLLAGIEPGPSTCHSLASLHTYASRVPQVPLCIALPAPSS